MKAESDTTANYRSVRRRAQANWSARNKLIAEGARDFCKVPGYFGSSVATRILIGLAVNGPGRKIDMYRTVASSLGPIRTVAKHFERIGLLRKSRLRIGYAYWLNPDHPAHNAVVAYCRKINDDYHAPIWDAIPIERAKLGYTPVATDRVDPWFGNSRCSEVLLLIHASRGARLVQISRYFNDVNRHHAKVTLRHFEEIGVVARLSSGNQVAYVIDPRFRYHLELVDLLDALLVLYPRVSGRARALVHTFRAPLCLAAPTK